MLKLCENIIQEYKFGQFARKQKSVNKLWPKFFSRVDKVADRGGVRLNQTTPDYWRFKVVSGTHDGLKYDVYVHFKNLPEMIDKHVQNRKLWKKDGSGVNHNQLAAEVFNDVDMQIDCTCPADIYWGMEYIKTQRDAQFGDPENRRPKKRNPREYGINCKHAHLVFQTLPFYVVTLGSYLKKYFSKEVGAAEDNVKKETAQIEQGKTFLAKAQP